MLQTRNARAAGAAKSGTLLVIIPSAAAENIFNRRNCSVARLNLQGTNFSMGEAEKILVLFLCRRAALLSDAKSSCARASC